MSGAVRKVLVEFTKSFHLGGTEGQVAELLRALPRHYEIHSAVLDDSGGPYLPMVRALGYQPRAFPLRGSVARPNTLGQIARMALWLRKIRADLVHVHDFYSTIIAVPAAKLAGCKVVVGRLDLAHWHGPARRQVLTQLSRMADHVIANAEAIRTMLVQEERLSPSKVTVIRNGIDLAAFDRKAASGLEAPLPETGGDPVAVLVANMNHPVKRQEDFLAALALAHQYGHRLHGFLVGDGPRRAKLEQVAQDLGVGRFAHFLGHRTDVPAAYARATFGVLCSNAEGLSNAVIEGMAGGLPMVVTDVGGNAELVQDGIRGKVVAPERPARLFEGFLEILRDPYAARRMGASARSFVERELSLAALVSRHDALYQEILLKGARSRRPAPAAPAWAR